MTAQLRRQRLQAAMREAGIESLLLTSLIDVRWATGFTGSNAAMLVHADGEAVFATDGRYTDQAAAEVPDLERIIDRSTIAALLSRAAGEVAVDPTQTTLAAWDQYTEDLGASANLTRATNPIALLRRVKDDDEVAALQRACDITDQALAVAWAAAKPGMTERELRRILDGAMLDFGGEVGFESIVASGPNSAIPHHQPTDRALQVGDFLKIDCGAMYDGYHADMTRMAVVGAEPADWQVELHALVLTAQQAGIDALKPGATAAELDHAARRIIDEAGHGEHYLHGLGHGVGLEIHEPPFLGASGTDRIDVGVPVTVEPGVYLSGRGGVRIEDTLLVGGQVAQPMTRTDRALRVVGK